MLASVYQHFPENALRDSVLLLARSIALPAERRFISPKLFRGAKQTVRQIVRGVDAVCTYTHAEYEDLQRWCGGTAQQHAVLLPGVDTLFATATPDAFVQHYGLRDVVLCVAKVEPLKNQVNLLMAQRDAAYDVVCIGQKSPHHPRYVQQFEEIVAAHDHFHYVPAMTQEELASAYAAARVHVLASWFDNSPMVDLEAALGGCAIVTTAVGYSREYLGADAWYVDPGDANSIRQSVHEAYQAGPAPALRERILAQHTWGATRCTGERGL